MPSSAARKIEKSADAYRSIGEAAEELRITAARLALLGNQVHQIRQTAETPRRPPHVSTR